MADLKTELFELVEAKELDALFGTSDVVEKTLKRAELNLVTAEVALPADQSAAWVSSARAWWLTCHIRENHEAFMPRSGSLERI
jgi:hypothetical protein